ncbi:MAG TPA: hypothetical protein DIC49_06120 [Gammaproteobacteria bacterium]|nr:hypothetical protein [Gammaproteobacteria bacterium]
MFRCGCYWIEGSQNPHLEAYLNGYGDFPVRSFQRPPFPEPVAVRSEHEAKCKFRDIGGIVEIFNRLSSAKAADLLLVEYSRPSSR